MRAISLVLTSLLLGAAAPAQADDFCGLRVFTGSGASGAPTPLVCGGFTCTPSSFSAAPGDTVQAVVMTVQRGFYAIAVSFDTSNLVCLDLGTPRIKQRLVIDPPGLITWAAGVATQPDQGRCNGGSEFVTIGTIPAGFPSGSMVFQALAQTPLSTGGIGSAFSSPVIMNF